MTHRITLLLEYTKPEEVEKRKAAEALEVAEQAEKNRQTAWLTQEVPEDYWLDEEDDE